jgi:hypothetical protein
MLKPLNQQGLTQFWLGQHNEIRDIGKKIDELMGKQ